MKTSELIWLYMAYNTIKNPSPNGDALIVKLLIASMSGLIIGCIVGLALSSSI